MTVVIRHAALWLLGLTVFALTVAAITYVALVS